MKFWLILLAYCLLILPAHAGMPAKDPHAAFVHLNQCIRGGAPARCRPLLTQASLPIYDRFVSYQLTDCLPTDAAYVSQQVTPAGVLVRVGSSANGKPRFIRLAFVLEGNGWKLDIPESLHVGLGDNWRTQLDTTEQIFLMMRAQMDGQLNCALIQGLAKK